MVRAVPWFVLTTVLGAQQVQPPASSAAPSPTDSASIVREVAPPAESIPRVTFAPQPAAPPRPCPGCPPRRLGTAFLQTTYINVVYELANLFRGQVTAKITPGTWWTNMKRGWEWDLDDFVVNQIGHPYQGNNYFNAGRANGLNFWESAALTAFGSGTWEYFGETNQASLNDFINTTMGGIALGEMFHRTAWLVRNTHATGKGRLWNEIGATAIDPITGLNRFISGDAGRVEDKPAEFVPEHMSALSAVGVAWRGSDTRAIDAKGTPFFQTDLVYGDPLSGHSRDPYDAFAVRLEFGGGSPISEATVRGRLLGQPLRNGTLQFSILQGYQFNHNDAYQFGAQSVEVAFMGRKDLSRRWSMFAGGAGGLTVLGAVDSQPLPTPFQPDEENDEDDAGQGVSTGPRGYDYGPGSNIDAVFLLRRDQRAVLNAAYELHHLHVLDGVRANHVLQRLRVDLLLPLRGPLGFGVSGEYFDRRTLYSIPTTLPTHFHYPQVRAYFTWGAGK